MRSGKRLLARTVRSIARRVGAGFRNREKGRRARRVHGNRHMYFPKMRMLSSCFSSVLPNGGREAAG